MWSITLLLNKFFNFEEGIFDDPNRDHSQLAETCSCSYEQSTTDGNAFCEAVLPSSCYIDVPHYNQQSSWDCGLACVLMVLKTIGINSCDIQVLNALCNINSIWTVDLAYLLQKFSVKFSYFTVTLGANPTFSVEKYYVNQFSNDLERVNMLFQNAVTAGIDIQCRSISEREISVFILSGKYVVIALVDQYKLRDSWLDDVSVREFFGHDTAYTGHYIVVCGYNTVKDEFTIRDPASSRNMIVISSKCLGNARKSFGTDEDLLLISLEKCKDQERLVI